MPVRDILMALVVVLIWGFNFTVIKLSVGEIPPLLQAALRFFFAAFPLALFIKPPKTSPLIVMGYGLFLGVILYSMLNTAIFLGMPASLSSLVLQTQVLFTIVLAYFILGERPQPIQLLGGAIAFAGLAVIGWERLDGADLLPFGLTLGAAMAWAIANILTKKAGQIDMLAFIVWASVFACVPLLGLSLLIDGPEALADLVLRPRWQVAAQVVFLAYMATVLGMALWSMLLSRHPASTVTPFALLVPVAGVISGVLVLGERITLPEALGGGVILIGLVVAVAGPRLLPQRSGGKAKGHP